LACWRGAGRGGCAPAVPSGLEFDSEGNPILPTDSVTGLKTNSLAELQKIILPEMQSETFSAQNLGVTAACFMLPKRR
jgi:hypothetical protein